MVMADFGTPWIKIKVAKPGILPGVKALGVIIERGTKT
jgi:dihydroneopterin aldolase